jgi:hypothetical protein
LNFVAKSADLLVKVKREQLKRSQKQRKKQQ